MAFAVLSVVLSQLATLIREESELLGGLRGEVQFIKDEFGQMKGFLRTAEAIVENHPELEAWISQVRDVAHDVEDILDDFVLRFGCNIGRGFLGPLRKAYGSIASLKSRHQISINLRKIEERVRKISEAHRRYQNQYGNVEHGFRSVLFENQNRNIWYDGRGDALLIAEKDLVGIESPKRKIMDMVSTGDSQLRVISVVGMGGLGKTTLVKKVFDDPNVKNRFKHHAWVTVSQSFNIETLLKQAIQQLLKELNQPPPQELDTMDINSLKQYIHDLLQLETYILVFDDVWRTTDWDAVRKAFPDNNSGSRIIITTRRLQVGQAAKSDTAGDIHDLSPLTNEESWNLFCRKAFRATSCPPHLKEIAGKIIQRCGGLPLAIVVIGSVMATKSRRTEEWELFNRSLGEQLAGDDQLASMTKLLSLSYYDLPDHLKICFLYLSIFPEDAYIEKMRLIRLWISEQLVPTKEGMTLEEVAEGHVNELINRNLLQVVETTEAGRVKACRVHDIIQQIILRKAREQDIVTILNGQGMHCLNRVRRLANHGSIDNAQVNTELLKCLRSLVLIETNDSMSKTFLSNLLSDDLKWIKVLDLRYAPLEAIPDGIFKMLHLKYLSLRNTKVSRVPKSIKKLQKLESIDLRDTKVRKLPKEILMLKELRHLLVGKIGFQAPYKIGNLQSLQTLSDIAADDQRDGVKIVEEIGKLTQLRKLGITKLRKEDGKQLCASLEKLINLRSLRIYSINAEEVIDLQYPLSSTPLFLHTLELWGRLERVPRWFRSLQGLTKIYLIGSLLMDDPLQVLQDLSNLVVLALQQAYQGDELLFKAGGFEGLNELRIWEIQNLKCVTIEKGAMPLLEKLMIGDCKKMVELPMGIEYVESVQHLELVNMSNEFVKMMEGMDKQSRNCRKIAHIPRVLLSNWEDNELRRQSL